jgi:hypothetical protein
MLRTYYLNIVDIIGAVLYTGKHAHTEIDMAHPGISYQANPTGTAVTLSMDYPVLLD